MNPKVASLFWGLAGAALVVSVAALVISAISPKCSHDSHSRPVVINNLKNLVLLLSDQVQTKKAWPEYSGPAFALSLVATGAVDSRRVDNLRVFWPDGEFPPGLDVERYAKITSEGLSRGDFNDLTSLAGRRNTDPRYRLETSEADVPEPILGWRYGKFVVLGFTDGSTQFFTQRGLGLAEGDPVVFGEASKSELLRGLSED